MISVSERTDIFFHHYSHDRLIICSINPFAYAAVEVLSFNGRGAAVSGAAAWSAGDHAVQGLLVHG
jgi:hypothetical protein